MDIVTILAVALYIVSIILALYKRELSPTYFAVLSAVTLYVLPAVL